MIKFLWKVWGLWVVRHYFGSVKVSWGYVDSLWHLVDDLEEGFLTPYEALSIDRQHWGD